MINEDRLMASIRKTKSERFGGYKVMAPRYAPLKLLAENLISQDTAFQSNQVAIEYLAEELDEKSNSKEFIRSLAGKYRISAGTTDISAIKYQMAKSYIVQTYNLAEMFFKEFIRVFRHINDIKDEDWIRSIKQNNSRKKLDPLNQILENIPKDKRKKLMALPEFELADYYRILRNGFVHRESSESESLEKANKQFERKVSKILDHFKGYYKVLFDGILPAPNPPQNITFRDFILYSRALRNLADYINDLCPMSVIQAFRLAEEDPKFFVTPKRYNYKTFPNNKGKLEIYLENYFTSNYGDNATHIDEFKSLFFSKY